MSQFKEKPDAKTAKRYLTAGPGKYLWNSGMFVWRARTLLAAIEKFAPENHAGLVKIGRARDGAERQRALAEVYPTLKKISVDFAIMEPASRDPKFRVVAVPMNLRWLDVGSWPSFAQTLSGDGNGNAISAGKTVLLDTSGTLIASNDPNHLIATIGCEGLIVIHTPDATLVCRADQAEDIKKLYALVGEKHGPGLL